MFLLVWLLPAVVGARATSFDTLGLRPTADFGPYFTLGTADFLAPRQWAAGFFLDYARNTLTAFNAAGARQPVVRDLLGGHLAASYGALDWLELGVNPNIALHEKFFDPATGLSSDRLRLGDIRFNAKLGILSKQDYPVGLAFIPYLDLPTGSGSSFVGSNSFAGGGNFALETRRIEERLTFALNLGYHARDRVLVLGTPIDDLVTFGFGANFLVMHWLELVSEFRGGTMVSDFGNSAGTPFEGGGGIRFFLDRDRRWQVTTGIGLGVGSGLGNPSIRGLAGIAYTPARPVKGVEFQEKVQEVFQVYELENVDEMEELRQKCPEKSLFNPKTDDVRCIKFYLRQ